MSFTGHNSKHRPRASANTAAASKSFTAIYVRTCKSAVKVTVGHGRNRHVPLWWVQFTQYLWRRMSHLEPLPVCRPPRIRSLQPVALLWDICSSPLGVMQYSPTPEHFQLRQRSFSPYVDVTFNIFLPVRRVHGGRRCRCCTKQSLKGRCSKTSRHSELFVLLWGCVWTALSVKISAHLSPYGNLLYIS